MKFRPCIDIHNGKVKQIVGSSLQDDKDRAKENFVAHLDASWYARLYRDYGLDGGHIILLNPKGSPYYEMTRAQAVEALKAYPGGLQIGGGITRENAGDYLDAGAQKVIVTSYVFSNGQIDFERLEKLSQEVGKDRLVLDLSCRKKEDNYVIVTDRWQKYTNVILDEKSLKEFSAFSDEFLVHAVDVEGKARGIEKQVVGILGWWRESMVTYAGGIHTYDDLMLLQELGQNRVDFTVGSALSLFGGDMDFERLARWNRG